IRIQQRTGAGRRVYLWRSDVETLQDVESLTKFLNLGFREGRIESVFDVCEVSVRAFDFQSRQLFDFINEGGKFIDGNSLTVCAGFNLEVNLCWSAQLDRRPG